MAAVTKISWCDATMNFWIGCDEVSTAATGGGACDGCYARNMAERYGWAKWGPREPRHRTGASLWRQARIWNDHPEKLIGDEWPARKPRVFTCSLADFFDNKVDPQWRAEAWQIIRETPNLQWLILTKRIGNVAKMLPSDWGSGYPNVCIMITVCNEPEASRDIWKLLCTPARWRGISAEPLLGLMDLQSLNTGWFFYDALIGYRWHEPADGIGPYERCPKLDWVVTGGMTDQVDFAARLMDPRWALSLMKQCFRAGVPFHHKHNGEFVQDGDETDGRITIKRVGRKLAGRLLDDCEHNGFVKQD